MHLTAKVDVPIVMVAAQRPPNGLGTDAGINIVNALRVASSPAARGMGVMLVMNDEIQCAREVTKTMNSRIHTFQSPDYGCLGQADPIGNIAFYRKPIRRYAPNTEFDLHGVRDLPRVDIVYSYAGVDGFVVEKLVEAGAKGIVIAGCHQAPHRPRKTRRWSRRATMAFWWLRAGAPMLVGNISTPRMSHRIYQLTISTPRKRGC